MAVNYYTDGSYSPQKKLGVAGFMVNDNIYLYTTTQKNTQCEYLAAKMSIHHAIRHKNQNSKIFTDCAGIINTINKEKWDKYPGLCKLLNELDGNIEWIKVKGHSKQSEKKEDDFQFQKIDKAVRKKLRNL